MISYTEINRNFLIRVTDVYTKESELHSARTYALLVGHETANKHFTDAFNKGEDKTTYNLRRGLKIEFVSK